MIKLYRARSLLYRRQNLQENIRWKALDEIDKIYMLLHRSGLNISEKIHQKISHFWQKFAKIRFLNSFHWFCSDFDENLSEFRQSPLRMLRLRQISEFLTNSDKMRAEF